MRIPHTAIVTAAAIALVTAAPTFAAGLSISAAAQAGSQAAQAVRKQTHGSSARVTRCSRISTGKAVCHAEARYTTGAKRCTFDVTVTQDQAPAAAHQPVELRLLLRLTPGPAGSNDVP